MLSSLSDCTNWLGTKELHCGLEIPLGPVSVMDIVQGIRTDPPPPAPFSLIPAQLLTHPTQSNTFPHSNIAIATMKGFFYPSVRACNCFVAFRASSVILCIAPYRVDIPVIHTTVHCRVDQKFRKRKQHILSVKLIIYSEVRCHYLRDARWIC